ncbi:unnamed protein product [Candida verbasci]|uniref:Fatty acid desaturase domain-containing protein n=1 Tax=Candida verbasci TaxID=1227364 RepID=A0A9W4U220_9ASCO|nr:unnamed protein product [Candida verbasci]
MSSAQTAFTSSSNGGKNHGTTTIKKSGNIAGFSSSNVSSNLTAIDTFGNKFEVPDFTIKEILQVIPSECYKRNLITSFYYVFRDIALILTVGYFANSYIPLIDSQIIRGCLWASYSFIQGLFLTGIWVLAHECGHQAFSDYGWVNDLTGWFLHSYLLVPYFSWKYTHSKHHKATGHLTRDMVFVPKTKQQFIESRGAKDLDDLLGDSPIYSLYQLILQQTMGWIGHLFLNLSGQKHPNHKFYQVNHFNPTSPLFDKKDYNYILLSDLGIILQSTILYIWYKQFGTFNFVINYFIPYLFVNHWLVFITFLQHSDIKMPHYTNDEWTFARGAAATIDREFGFIGKHLFHDIIETHVLHHYCSRIPFYNARKASEEIKKVMGKHYQHSDENMWVTLWKCARMCQFVDGDNGVLMYRNLNGFGVDPKKERK